MDLRKKIRLGIIWTVCMILIAVSLVLLKDFIITPIANPVRQAEPTVEYGIVTDSFAVIRDEVKPGQNLATLISTFNVGADQIRLLGDNCQGVFDLKKFRAGNEYTAMISNKADRKLQFFVYEVTDTNYIVFDFRDSLHVHGKSKEVLNRLSSASGVIRSSLWKAMEEADADPNLALALAQIYQWSIDFYSIQQGDEFRVIYESISVDGKPVGVGVIHSAVFRHEGKDFYAFRFEQGGVSEYFNEQGENLRREFLKAPLKFSRISSRFTNSRFHPVLRIRRPHHGVDYAAPAGTPVHSIGNGVVLKAGYNGGAGRMITIKHNGEYTTSYMHLRGFGDGIRNGARVSQGQVIGYVGSTGLSTGPHLDFRVYRNGSPVDPLKMESPPAYPVAAGLRHHYDSVTAIYKRNLKLIKRH